MKTEWYVLGQKFDVQMNGKIVMDYKLLNGPLTLMEAQAQVNKLTNKGSEYLFSAIKKVD